MHILFITDNFPPETNAPATRTFEHAVEWTQKGHKVTVITGNPNFPEGKIYRGYKNKLYNKELVDGIYVIRVWTYMAENKGVIRRTLDHVSFMITSILASFSVSKTDVIIGTSPQFFSAISAAIIATIKMKPFIFELRDLWPASIKAVGAIENLAILKILEKIEMYLYKRANLVISLTFSFRKNLTERGIPKEKIKVITNGVDIDEFKFTSKNLQISSKLGLKNKFIIGYIGTHGLAHDLETLINAAKIISSKHSQYKIHFLFIGDGAEKNKLIEVAKNSNLKNVIFIDAVPRKNIKDYWSILDLSVVHLKNQKLFETVIPSKIFESMAMGIPILIGTKGESRKIIEKYDCGLSFTPENAHELVTKILELYNNKAHRKKLGANAKRFAPKFDRKLLAAKMLDEISIVQNNSRT